MRKFCIHGLAFLVLLITMCALLQQFRDPFWGNEVHRYKLDFLRHSAAEFNTVFLGSSRVYRQLDPALFDAEMAGFDTASFNLATPATFNPEIYYLYERLLEDPLLDLDYAVIELNAIRKPQASILFTPRNFYWRDLPNTLYIGRYLLADEASGGAGWQDFEPHARSLIYNLAFRYLSLGFDGVFKPEYSDATRHALGPDRNGLFLLERELVLVRAGVMESENLDLPSRVQRRDEDMRVVRRRAARVEKIAARRNRTYSFNPIHLARLQDLLSQSESRGIRLLYLLSPRGGVRAHFQLQALKSALPPNTVIDLSNPAEFPEFHSPEYSFDRAHLNTEGSRLYTRAIASQAKKILGSDK